MSATAAVLPAAGRLEQRLRPSPGCLGLVPYLMAGHPDPATSLRTARRLVDLGVAALELGIPCPDPRWDGPVVAGAGRQALERGTTVAAALALAGEIAAGTDVPIVLMTYAAPLLDHGAARFAGDAAAAGVAGVIVPDLGDEHRRLVARHLRAAGLDVVSVVAPDGSEPEVALECAASSGFVYCALARTTGSRAALGPTTPALLDRVRRHTGLPIAAGFGVSRPEHVAALRGRADAAVVGSAIVAELGAGRDVVPLARALLAACR